MVVRHSPEQRRWVDKQLQGRSKGDSDKNKKRREMVLMMLEGMLEGGRKRISAVCCGRGGRRVGGDQQT